LYETLGVQATYVSFVSAPEVTLNQRSRYVLAVGIDEWRLLYEVSHLSSEQPKRTAPFQTLSNLDTVRTCSKEWM